MTELQSPRSLRRDQSREDRRDVLRLLETGDISAAEADALLDALEAADGASSRATVAPSPGGGAIHRLRVRVTDAASGKPTVNLTLPIGLVEVGLNLARRFAPDKLPTVEAIRQAFAIGATGALVDVTSEKDRVEIILE